MIWVNLAGSFMAIIGNEKVVTFLEDAWAGGKLSHACCLVGPDQIGKNKIANFLASKILQVDEGKLGTHPDFYYLSRVKDEKSDKLKKNISISQARNLKSQISNKSWLGKYRVVIIDEAEYLNKESGNALLKILEETQKNTVFFLLTVDDNLLLPTIKSRCQLFYLALAAEKELESGLISLGYEQKKVKDVLLAAWNRPGRAIDLLSDEQEGSLFVEETKRWQKILQQPFYKRLQLVKDLIKTKEGANKEHFQQVLDNWIMIWRNALKDKVNNIENDFIKNSSLNLVQITDLIDLLKRTKILLKQNINPNLLIEKILLTIRADRMKK